MPGDHQSEQLGLVRRLQAELDEVTGHRNSYMELFGDMRNQRNREMAARIKAQDERDGLLEVCVDLLALVPSEHRESLVVEEAQYWVARCQARPGPTATDMESAPKDG